MSAKTFFIFQSQCMLLLKNFCICLRSITIGIGSLSYLLIFLFKQFKLTVCIIHRTVSIQEQLLRKDFQSKTDIKRSLTVRCRTSQFIFPIIRITILITPSGSRTSILIPRIPSGKHTHGTIEQLILSRFSVPRAFQVVSP